MITDAGYCLYAKLKNEAAAVSQQLLASIELEKLVHVTELLEQLQCIFRARHDDVPLDQDRCDC